MTEQYKKEIEQLAAESKDYKQAAIDAESRLIELTENLLWCAGEKGFIHASQIRSFVKRVSVLDGCKHARDAFEEVKRLTAENKKFRDMLKIERNLVDEVEALTAEVRAQNGLAKKYRMALQEIADSYTPNWKPGDTHQSTQRLSEIAWKALGEPTFAHDPEIKSPLKSPLGKMCEHWHEEE